MTQRTYFEEDGPVWELWRRRQPDPAGTGTPVRHGFTLSDIQHAAVIASRRVWGGHTPHHERMDIAWSAITETLYGSDECPQFVDLINAGQEAVSRHVSTEQRHHGKAQDNTPRRAFAVYWDQMALTHPGPEAKTIESVALTQVWGALSDLDREVLTAVAAYHYSEPAAAALGMGMTSFRAHLRAARLRFQALWFEFETAPPLRLEQRRRRTKTVCKNGHEYTDENTGWEMVPAKKQRRRYCIACRTAWAEEYKQRRRSGYYKRESPL